jgi:hypothetical protein
LLAVTPPGIPDGPNARGRGPVGNADDAAGSHGAQRRLDIVDLCDVERQTVEWVWANRIPVGMLTLVVGDPGSGKSNFTMALAAALTRGDRLPGDDRDHDQPRRVVLFNAEDPAEHTLAPRADLCGADDHLVSVVRGVLPGAHTSALHIRDLMLLHHDLILRPDTRVLIVDPVASLLGRIDAYRDNEVRTVLQPLLELARVHNLAVVAVMHLRKGEAERIIYRAAGSIAFTALARSVLLVAQDPRSGRRAIAHIKSNVGPIADPIEFDVGEAGFTWLGVSPELSAECLLAPAPRAPSKRTSAASWLREFLADGPRLAVDVFTEGHANGHTERTLRRAADELGVEKIQERQPGVKGVGPSWWRVPSCWPDPEIPPLDGVGQPLDDQRSIHADARSSSDNNCAAVLAAVGHFADPGDSGQALVGRTATATTSTEGRQGDTGHDAHDDGSRSLLDNREADDPTTTSTLDQGVELLVSLFRGASVIGHLNNGVTTANPAEDDRMA